MWAVVHSGFVLSCASCLFAAINADALPQTSTDIRFVTTPERLQRAIVDGVRHIVVGDHLAVNELEADPEGLAATMDNAIGDLLPSTRSIIGNCTEAPPVEWQSFMKEPLPPRACVIRTPEDFVEMTKGVGELWIHNLYVMVDTEPVPEGSSNLLLQHDGSLWITQSVFQGRGEASRAIDMNTKGGGLPLLYVANTTFSDFNRDHGAAIRMLAPSLATMVDVAFKRTTVFAPEPPSDWEGMAGSAITAVNDSKIWLENVILEDQMVYDMADSSMAISWTSQHVPPGAVFSDLQITTWDYGLQQLVPAQPLQAAGKRFLTSGSVLTSLQKEQEQFEATLYLSPVSDSGTPGTASGTPDNTASDPGSIDKGTGPEPVTMEDVTGGDRSGGSSSDEQSAALLYVVVGAVVAVLLAAVALMLALHKRRKRRRRAAHKAASSAAAAAYMSKPPGSQPVHSSNHEGMGSLPGLPLPSMGPLSQQSSGDPQSMSSFPSNAATHRRDSTADSSDPCRNFVGSAHTDNQSAPNSLQDRPLPSNVARARNAFGLPTVTHSTTFDVTTRIVLSKPTTAGSTLDRETLELALDRLAVTNELFVGKFEMLGPVHRREGGQGTVQFALAKRSGEAVAIKFFLNRNAFDVEEALYVREGLRSMMPAITMIENNDLGVAVTEEGWRFPPFIVVERGESLDEWQARIQPDFPTIVQVLSHVTERVSTMHGLGLVHRDLKPGNVLWRPGQHSWTLIDFGCAANTGEVARLTYSLAYSAPETLSALNDGAETIVASTSLDMWAVGVIAYELMTAGTAFPTLEWMKWDIHAAALGKRAYPWESSIGHFRHIPQLRGLKEPVCACLCRDPKKRPTSEQFLSQLNAMFDFHSSTHHSITSTTTHTTTNGS